MHGRPDRTLPGPNLSAIARSHGSLRRRAVPYAIGTVRRERGRRVPDREGAGQRGARDLGHTRQSSPNSALSGRLLREVCALGGDAQTLFSRAVNRMGLSGRVHDRVLRVARTVADLSGEEEIAAEHVAEALNYRRSHLIGR